MTRRPGSRRICVLAALALSAACARRVDLKEQDAAVDAKRVVVSALGHDAKGRPVVPPPLRRRPASPGESFTVARLERGRLIESFDVAVVDAADFQRPLRAVYEWTSDGAEKGLSVSGDAAQAILNGDVDVSALSRGSGDSQDARAAAALALVFVVTPAVVGAVGGSAVGLADGTRLSVEELGKLLRGPSERLISYTSYSYDARDRLVLSRLYAADRGKELARTEYRYAGDADVPVRTEITNLQNGTSKVLE